MTEIEAKGLMLIEKECINRDCDRNCAICDIVQKVDDLNNAYGLATNALDKQIPKKAESDMTSWYCPNCHSRRIERKKHKYCFDCGQKLDWGD